MASNRDPFTPLDPDGVRDLGFGAVVASNVRKR